MENEDNTLIINSITIIYALIVNNNTYIRDGYSLVDKDNILLLKLTIIVVAIIAYIRVKYKGSLYFTNISSLEYLIL